MNYVFDVDGTLTPSRMRIDREFEKFFLEFIENNNVYLVTGSDYEKTVQQVGSKICESVIKCFNCSGNSIWQNGEEIYTNTWDLSSDAVAWLKKELTASKFNIRTGQHIEYRPGLVNFSIVGRGADFEQRFLYTQWDQHKNERKDIARRFNETFTHYRAQVAGETGLDILRSNSDKRQVADFIKGPISFFGDKMEYGGNDYPLADEIEQRNDTSCNYKVKDWKDTQRILFAIENSGLHKYVGVI